MSQQELIRQTLLKTIEKYQTEKDLGKGEWFHCGTTFKTTEEFVEHWKTCPNIPNSMKYTDYPCQKCWLISKCVLNGKVIYKHRCSGVAQKPKPEYLQQAEGILKEVEQIRERQRKIQIIVGMVLIGIILVAGIGYLIWKIKPRK